MQTNRNRLEIDLWQQTIELAQRIYRLTLRFPDDERLGISQQLRETATEVACSVSEDVSNGGPCDEAVAAANRKLLRLKTLLLIAEGLGYPKDEEALPHCLKVSRLLARASDPA